MKSIYVSPKKLQPFIQKVFENLDVPKNDAKICAEITITADRWGFYTHGVNRLKTVYYKRLKLKAHKPKTKTKLVRNKKAIGVLDGKHGMGHIIANRAMHQAIIKAKKYGIGMIAVKNSSHFGIAGYYAHLASQHNMVGIVGTNARPGVSPTFGVENILGTNPLAIGFPTKQKFGFMLDFSTAVAQRGKIEQYAKNKKALPKGWVIDRQGKSVLDAKEALKLLTINQAALTPLGGDSKFGGGHKGYGLSVALEILSSALSGAPFMATMPLMDGSIHNTGKLGHFFIAIDIDAFTSVSKFKKSVDQFLNKLRKSKKVPGQKNIYAPGDLEALHAKQVDKKGIELTPETQKELLDMAEVFGITKIPF